MSTYPPRRCGIASYTAALAAAAGDSEIAALITPERGTPYPLEVHHRIRQDEPGDYRRTASELARCVEVVAVQHDFSIWGPDDGAAVLEVVDAVGRPIVTTLHDVRPAPSDRRQAILRELVERSAATVVLSRHAADLLRRTTGVDARRIEIIPHGVPDLPAVAADGIKPGLGVAGHDVILGFGLLRPEKGCELVIDALPAIIASHPTALYVIVGPTHPDLLARDGEAYRESLTERAQRLGVAGHVRFVDRFVGRVEMIRWLQAADVFVTPYTDLDHGVSGSLAYAMSAGRAIVSTPFADAQALLADGRGVIVEPGSPSGLADAIDALLSDDPARAAMGARAHRHARPATWSAVGLRYRELFDRVADGAPATDTPSVNGRPRPFPVRSRASRAMGA